jgi:hypothetical protein
MRLAEQDEMAACKGLRGHPEGKQGLNLYQ